jgi:hypothetical protein
MHQSAFSKDRQVLNHCGETDGERLCPLGDRDWASAQFFNDRTAGGIAQSMDDAVGVNC